MSDRNSYILLKDALKHLTVKERALQMRCKKLGFNKTLEGYKIPIDVFNGWKEKQTAKKPQRNRKPQTAKQPQQLTIDTESKDLTITIENLHTEIASLKAELKQYDIADNEQIEVFTNEEYNLFEQRLKEWRTQRLEIEHQEQLFAAETKSNKELYNHYKAQFEYQKTANDKILEMHQKLIDVIGEQNKLTIQRQIIEAADKEIINKNSWKTKE